MLFVSKDKYENPVLVSSTDGVGTKLKIAFLSDVHNTVGQCLVNHCIDDILAVGARPLFFLDYFATGKLSVEKIEQVMQGFAKACKENSTVLIGGETAEMPDFYQEGEYDSPIIQAKLPRPVRKSDKINTTFKIKLDI